MRDAFTEWLPWDGKRGEPELRAEYLRGFLKLKFGLNLKEEDVGQAKSLIYSFGFKRHESLEEEEAPRNLVK